MATWATLEAEITGTPLSGYTRLEYNEDPRELSSGQTTKTYSLKVLGFDERQLTNKKVIGTFLVELVIKYTGYNNATRTANIDTFEGVKGTIANLANFAGFETETKFEDVDKKWQVGVMKFWYGLNES